MRLLFWARAQGKTTNVANKVKAMADLKGVMAKYSNAKLPSTVVAVYDQGVRDRKKRAGRVLLPPGEGGPKGRMRALISPSPAASRHPLPEGEGTREKRV